MIGMKDRRRFWVGWLLAVTAAVTLFGLIMVALPGVAERFFAWMIFGTDVYPFGPGAVAPLTTDPVADPAAYARFVTAVLGAVMVGWGLLMAFVVAIPLQRGERWAWWGLLVALGTWFVVDTAVSLILGFGENALLNTAVLIACAPGLVGTRPGADS
jgi:hypothetical protein